jgi:hypothetical protein
MKTVAYTGRFYTTADRVRPPGAEIEEGNLLAKSLAYNPSQTAAREPVVVRRESIETLSPTAWQTGVAPSTSGLASASSTYPAPPPSWTSFFTQSMSVLSGSGEDSTDKDKELVNSNSMAHGKDYNPDQRHFITRFLQSTSITPDPHEQSFESFHTPQSSPSADDGNMSDVFVTPPPIPDPASAGTGAAATGQSSGLRTPTPPCATSRPLVSDT